MGICQWLLFVLIIIRLKPKEGILVEAIADVVSFDDVVFPLKPLELAVCNFRAFYRLALSSRLAFKLNIDSLIPILLSFLIQARALDD